MFCCKVANFLFRTLQLRCLVPSSRSANCRILEGRVWLKDSLPVINPSWWKIILQDASVLGRMWIANEVYLVSRQQNVQASNLLSVPVLAKSAFVSAVLHSMRLLVPALQRLEMITVHFLVILLIKPNGIQSSISPGRSCRMGRKPPWPWTQILSAAMMGFIKPSSLEVASPTLHAMTACHVCALLSDSLRVLDVP